MVAAPRILISYRREDAAGHAGALYDRLSAALGTEQVFMHLDDLPSGEHWQPIGELVGSAEVLVAVIGKDWLEAMDASGRRRLDDDRDFVRLEIIAALNRGLRVIPVLVGGATMPRADELPDALKPLASRHALEISDQHWDLGVRRLVETLAPEEDRRDESARSAPQTRRDTATGAFAFPLPTMLQAAARGGVVPATATVQPAAPAPVPSPFETYPPPAPAPEIPYPEPVPAEAPDRAVRRPLATPLLWIAAPLALLGAAAITAKWLLGWFIEALEPSEAATDPVECTVFAPPSARPAESLLVQAFVHRPEEADDAWAIASELDIQARRRVYRTLHSRIARGTRVDFELRLPGLEIDDPVTSIVWHGRTEAVQFGVTVPAAARAGTVIGTLDVALEGAPVGHLKFKLSIERGAAHTEAEPQGESARRYTAAFISYASADRDKVLERVQMLSIAGIRYFQDVLDLEPGDRWLKKLELGIDEADLFLLFWSNEAKQSRWVREEVAYALARKAGDDLSPPEIRPVIIEGPPIVAPWEELAHLHFNDKLVYFLNR